MPTHTHTRTPMHTLALEQALHRSLRN
jgi:hypothetical protein